MEPCPIPRHTVLALRREVTDLRTFFDAAYPVLARVLEAAGVVPAACRAYYFSAPDESFDVAAAFVLSDAHRAAVATVLDAAEYPAQLLDFPEGSAVVARFEQDYAMLPEAWNQFETALRESGHDPSEVAFEDYVLMPGQDGGPVTDLYWYV